MKLEDFNYFLPKELIAKRPIENKESKILICKNDEIVNFKKLTYHFSENDVLILNNTKVIPAIITGYYNNKIIKVTLLEKNNNNIWKAFIKPAKKVKVNEKIIFTKNINCTVLKKESVIVEISFNVNTKLILNYLNKNGDLPLPPYTKTNPDKELDNRFYQNVYAKKEGSVACPTAGLHFDNELIADFKKKNIEMIFTTLHVGLGTFLPLSNEKVKENKLHKERGIINKSAAIKINNAINSKKNIIAVGTTVVRLLESCFKKYGKIKQFNETTNLFIYPGFKFNVVDSLITNFHLPKSSLLILVSAFAGKENIQYIYKYAIKSKMKFFSFGDAMMVEKNDI